MNVAQLLDLLLTAELAIKCADVFLFLLPSPAELEEGNVFGSVGLSAR